MRRSNLVIITLELNTFFLDLSVKVKVLLLKSWSSWAQISIVFANKLSSFSLVTKEKRQLHKVVLQKELHLHLSSSINLVATSHLSLIHI